MNKMIKKTIACCLMLFSVVQLFAQTGLTGINTLTPQQQLHIAGTSSSTQIGTSGINVVKPTIRIDGLNNTNNAALYSASPSLVQDVFITQNGDLVIGDNAPKVVVATALGTDEIPTAVTLNDAGTNAGATTVLKTYTFTLTQSSLVNFLGSISISVFNSSGGSLIDGVNRNYSAFFRFTTAPAGVTVNQRFGNNGASYTNNIAGSSAGIMYMQPETSLVLPAGSYTVELAGGIYGGSEAFRAIMGGGTDMVSIVVLPL